MTFRSLWERLWKSGGVTGSSGYRNDGEWRRSPGRRTAFGCGRPMASEPKHWLEATDRPDRSDEPFGRWILDHSERLWKPLVYSAAYLAVIAVAEVLVVQYLFSLPPSPAPIIVGLITFAVYANDRLVDLESDSVSNPYRTAFVRQYRAPLYVLAALAYGTAVALSAVGGPVAFTLALLPGAAWVLYAVNPKLAVEIPFQRLKERLVVNSLLVAVAWSVTVVFLPLAFAGRALTPAVGAVFAYFVLATFVNTEVANVGDIESDREAGVATLPTVLGVRRTRHALYGIILLAATGLGYATVDGHLTGRAAVALGVGLVCLTGIVACLGRVERETLLTVAAECTRLPVFALITVPVFL